MNKNGPLLKKKKKKKLSKNTFSKASPKDFSFSWKIQSKKECYFPKRKHVFGHRQAFPSSPQSRGDFLLEKIDNFALSLNFIAFYPQWQLCLLMALHCPWTNSRLSKGLLFSDNYQQKEQPLTEREAPGLMSSPLKITSEAAAFKDGSWCICRSSLFIPVKLWFSALAAC